jgi:hypothetical protein
MPYHLLEKYSKRCGKKKALVGSRNPAEMAHKPDDGIIGSAENHPG